MSRHIETKILICEVLEKIVDMKRRLDGSQSNTHDEKGCLLDTVSKVAHKVLYTAHRFSGDPDSGEEEDPVTNGA